MTGIDSGSFIMTNAVSRGLASVLLCVGLTAALPGCGGGQEFADVRKQLEDIRQRPRGAIQPPPEFESQPTHTYAGHKLRSPFQPQAGYDDVSNADTSAIAPDLTRPREYLEQFNIEALRMKGTMRKEGQSLTALVDDGAGGTHPVRTGNYLGKNFGRVVSVEESRISLLEIVPDGHDGWVERPRTIRLEGE